MQLTFSCVPDTFRRVESTLSEARLGRYLRAANGDKHYALRLYVWNARLSEALYLPTQVCEVAVRNAIHKALRSKHGENWYMRGSFLCTLTSSLKSELEKATQDERAAYGSRMTVDHLVSALSFGFWIHLLTRKYEGVFWPKYFRDCFPHKPDNVDRRHLYDMTDKVRHHRNRIAHHKPIFDRFPTAEYQNLLLLISWICEETHWLTLTTSSFSQTINAKPSC